MPTVHKKKRVHFIANCMDCSWETADFLKGDRAAKGHAERYKHKVSAEAGYAMTYNGRGKESVHEQG